MEKQKLSGKTILKLVGALLALAYFCLLYTSGMFQYEYYVDDGYTGRNFNRPSFQRMIADIEAGKIGCVITKDYCAIIGLNQKDLENQGILA